VHIIWPKKQGNGSAWYDTLEYIFDSSYRFTTICIRGVAKDGSDSVDLDF
jgi:hypothetical protein